MHKWSRVNRRNRCPICNHSTWCLIQEEKCICMRQVSQHPKMFKNGETGYIHHLTQRVQITRPIKQERIPTVDVNKLLTTWRANPVVPVSRLAESLGVSVRSLDSLGTVYAPNYRAWAFPMRDGRGGMVGIRLRDENGRKWAVTGSHQGLFYADDVRTDLCVVCEGPTDTAAAMTLGFATIGRPSCSGGVSEIAMMILTRKIRRLAIIADNDEPGLNGARSLSEYVPIPSVTVVLPCKDVRKFVQLGGNRTTLEALINSSVWTRK